MDYRDETSIHRTQNSSVAISSSNFDAQDKSDAIEGAAISLKHSNGLYDMIMQYDHGLYEVASFFSKSTYVVQL